VWALISWPAPSPNDVERVLRLMQVNAVRCPLSHDYSAKRRSWERTLRCAYSEAEFCQRQEGQMGSGQGDTPEVKQALAKAEECAKAAALAKTDKDRDYYERMRRKWLGVADGWRVIDEVGEAS
jgi:hypothetical protein